MALETISTILLQAIADPGYRETLFEDFPSAVQGCDLTPGEQATLAQLSRRQFEALVGRLVLHEIEPVQAGRRIWIAPSWNSGGVPPGAIALRLEAGVVFGNGTHATTRLCLAALEDRLRPGALVIDLGTGTGILAIGAAKLGAACVRAVDVAPAAVAAARRNVEANGVADRVCVEEGSLDSLPRGAADLVVANLLTHILQRMFCEGLAGVLKPGGVLIASGLPDEHVPLIAQSAALADLKMLESRSLDGWSAVILQRRRNWFHWS